MKTATVFLILFVVGASQAVADGEGWAIGFIGSIINRTSLHVSRIFNGTIVQGRDFPGIVAILEKGDPDTHNCGGSIVNENYIVTAAHCIPDNAEDMIVLSGTNSLVQGGIRHNVLETHIHEGYNESDSWINDIAVVKVDPQFVFDENTAAVSLPSQGQDTPAGSIATVVGWGDTEDGTSPDDLLMVSIQISNQEECAETYSKIHLNVYPQQICAGTEEGNEGSCNGDSGGPLYVDGRVIGLVSWARGCSLKGWPTVYTRVSAYIDWINSKVSS